MNTQLERMNAKSPVLDHEYLKRYPSIMAEAPAGRTSSRYSFIPTTRIIEQFEAVGFYPVLVKEAHAGDDRQGFQKHLIRFRQPNVAATGLDKLFPEIVLTNSHDAGASFKLMMGIFRLVCTNGAVVGESFGGTIRINHVGYTDQAVRDAVRMIGDRLPQVMDRVDEFKALEMTPDDKGVFALEALGTKYSKEDLIRRTFDTDALLLPARAIDSASTLWNSYNTVQERLVERGGRIEHRKTRERYNYRTRQMEPVIKAVRTRAVNSPAENVKVNQRLWELAEDFNTLISTRGHCEPGSAKKVMNGIIKSVTGVDKMSLEDARTFLEQREAAQA